MSKVKTYNVISICLGLICIALGLFADNTWQVIALTVVGLCTALVGVLGLRNLRR